MDAWEAEIHLAERPTRSQFYRPVKMIRSRCLAVVAGAQEQHLPSSFRLETTCQPRVASYEGVWQDGTSSRLHEEGQLRGDVQGLGLQMQRGSFVDSSVFYDILKKCIAKKDLVLGTHVHALAVKGGYGSDAFLANHIICMYASHGRLEEAAQVFTKVAMPNRYMWASIILAHARHGQATKAIKYYRQMRETGVKPDNHIHVAVLKACGVAKDLSSGKKVHADILGGVGTPNTYVGSCLVDMYAKCGSMDDARRVFDSLPNKNVVTWNAMLAGYAQHGLGQDALTVYERMQQEGIVPADRVTFVCLLQGCAGVGALHQGQQLHAQIQQRGLEADVRIGNCLVSMYARCGCLNNARKVFDNLPYRDVVTWNAMIAGYAQHGLGEEALALYGDMQQIGITLVDASTFASLLQACASIGALLQGKQLHARIQDNGLESDVVVGTCLVDMYSKCGSLEHARTVFDKLPRKNVVTWTVMITGYAQHGLGQEALNIYDNMQQEGITMANAVTYVGLLQACTSTGALHQGKRIHAQIRERGLEADIVTGNSLVNMYAKCGSLVDARSVFDNLPNRDVVTWNSMIAGYTQHGLGQEAVTLYESMQREGVTPADANTYVSLLKACGSMAGLEKGRKIHAEISQTGLMVTDLVISNSLIDMYSKCGSLEDARKVFDNLQTRNVVTWTAMIAGYAQHGLSQEALHLYASMQQEDITPSHAGTFVCLLQACACLGALHQGEHIHAQIQEIGLERDLMVGTCLVDMYAKCGRLKEALKVFDSMPTKNVVTWTAMIAGYAQQGLSQEALSLYASMQQEGVTQANAVTFICLLQSCGSVAALETGKEIHAEITKLGRFDPTDLFVANSLIDMYGKCGSMVDARNVFDGLRSKDIVTWNAIMAGYTRQGESELVFDLFQKMSQKPDSITFLNLITVCSHVGLVDKGQGYFQAMIRVHGLTPTIEHYTSVIDLLGRAGQVEKAMSMVETMSIRPSSAVWRCLLGACRKWRNVELGRRAFQHAISLDSNDAAAYVLMSNIYAAAQMQEEAREIQMMRVKTRAWKKPGQSWWTDIHGTVHTFVVGDRTHPEWQHIDAKVKHVFSKLKVHGYVPHLESVLQDMPDDEKEAALCGHSEKLAIAYALHTAPEGTTIRVVKNLRVCEDCHRATALISKMEQRTIICRDASRFHVYKDGKCSCEDYW